MNEFGSIILSVFAEFSVRGAAAYVKTKVFFTRSHELNQGIHLLCPKNILQRHIWLLLQSTWVIMHNVGSWDAATHSWPHLLTMKVKALLGVQNQSSDFTTVLVTALWCFWTRKFIDSWRAIPASLQISLFLHCVKVWSVGINYPWIAIQLSLRNASERSVYPIGLSTQ